MPKVHYIPKIVRQFGFVTSVVFRNGGSFGRKHILIDYYVAECADGQDPRAAVYGDSQGVVAAQRSCKTIKLTVKSGSFEWVSCKPLPRPVQAALDSLTEAQRAQLAA